ncbi:MAG: GNAT family N-acetyltransferase [Flavicella sp.]
MNPTKKNIYNVTTLWKTSGETFAGYSADIDFELSYIKNSEWPNKLWVKPAFTTPNFKTISNEMRSNPDLTFSYFRKKVEKPLDENSLILKSTLYGMNLPLQNKFSVGKTVTLKRVENLDMALAWSEAFYSAFRYRITPNTIEKTKKYFAFYGAYEGEKIIGTVLLFITDKTAGIHSLGIVHSERKKGHATAIMKLILNKALDLNCNLASLQSSKMGKNIYLSMGFQIDFLMDNYRIKL